ncbi:YTH domain-containing protein 1-like isoform X2 [Gigantopelta aegis]|uniref:YTH domain-containing protein 1-like isoform X2 n=1 Tax=Gigantopelta aegis TaxID=1735272 RepID=UPI001B8898A0|nr:YTH domain-containing protein 1-like isoform X2 [Gigantopelta aegis]
MSTEIPDSRDGIVNVLDDILDGTTGEDEFTGEVTEEKPEGHLKEKKTGKTRKTIVKTKGKVVKQTKQANTVTKEVVTAAVEPDYEQANVKPKPVSKKKTVVKKRVAVKKKAPEPSEETDSIAEPPVKVAKQTVKKVKPVKKVSKAKKLKEAEEKVCDDLQLEEETSMVTDTIADSDVKCNLSLSGGEDEEVKQTTTDGDTQDYDTRSEADSTGGDESNFTESDGELGDQQEAWQGDRHSEFMLDALLKDGEVGADGESQKKKGKKKRLDGREISPIEWDKSEEDSEKSEEDEDDIDDDKSDISNESFKSNKSGNKSDSETERRRFNAKLKYIFRNARYFLIKSNNHENVALAKAKGVWSTPPQNEARLNQAFRESNNVILIFSVKESGKFQGFARIGDESTKDHPPIRWVLPPGMSARALSGVFKLDWVCRRELPFTKAGHLHNPWNEYKPVKIGRDGQEIEGRCGETLCKLFPPDTKQDIDAIIRKARKSRHLVRPVKPRERRGTGRPFEFSRRRRSSREGYFEGPRFKRNRGEFERNEFFRGRRMDRPPRGFPGVRRETIINGNSFQSQLPEEHVYSYSDYIREFAHVRPPPPPMPPYGPPPPGYFQAPPDYRGYGGQHQHQQPRNFMPGNDYRPESSHSRNSDKRSYERDVDDFLRRTTHGTSSSRSTDRDRDRDREHHRSRDRDRMDRDRYRDRR